MTGFWFVVLLAKFVFLISLLDFLDGTHTYLVSWNFELQHLEPFVFLSPIFLSWVEMEGVGCPSLVHIYNHNYDCPLLLHLYP